MTDALNTAREALISVSATALAEFIEWSSCGRDRMDHDGKQKWRDAKVSLAAALSAAQAPTQQTGVRSYTLPLDPTAAPGASWTNAVYEAAQPILNEISLYGPSAGEDDDELVTIRLGDVRGLRTALATLNPAPPPQATTERDAFEAWYCDEAAEHGLTFTPSEIAALRDGEYYGDRVALNSKWEGWQGRAATAPPPQISEPVEGVRKALGRLKEGLDAFECDAADAWAIEDRPDLWDQVIEVPISDVRTLIAALSRGEGAEPVPATIYKAVERVLDENSAWIARPSKDVTEKVALAAGISWQQYTSHHPEAGAPSRPRSGDINDVLLAFSMGLDALKLADKNTIDNRRALRAATTDDILALYPAPPVPALKASDLEREGPKPRCYCPPGRCMAPSIMGAPPRCLDPDRAAIPTKIGGR